MKMGEVARLFLDLDEAVVEILGLMEVEGKAGEGIYRKRDEDGQESPRPVPRHEEEGGAWEG